MKVVFLTGSHPRHASVARSLFDAGLLTGLVIEQRVAHQPEPPNSLSEDLKKLFRLHFQKRADAEYRFFKDEPKPDVEQIMVSKDEVNTEKVWSFIRKIKPDLLLSYGVHFLTEETLASCNGEKWNIHGGLSPWYRGCITHFWPSYFLEPQMTGMTVHDLSQEIDAGEVIHQNAAPLVKGDGLHDLACRAVDGISKELPQLINLLNKKGKLEKRAHKTSGRIWTAKDWRPEHLRPIYEFYQDGIVDLVLNKEIIGREPRLYRQL